MMLAERDQNVQAFPPERAQEPLTQGVGLGTPHGGCEGPQPQVAYTLVELLGENGITVVDEEPVHVIRGDRFTQLLQGPWRGGMHSRADL